VSRPSGVFHDVRGQRNGGVLAGYRSVVIWSVLAGVVVALVAAWLVLVVALLRQRPRGTTARDTVRLLPDLVRLVARLARDPDVPRSPRIALWALIAYLASPVDLVPDFIPVIGYADDVIAVLLVLRFVIRRAGVGTLERLWPGTVDGLAVVLRATGSPASH
jgi:uncharacterized membrane protein YkvA (DUF1232 family)